MKCNFKSSTYTGSYIKILFYNFLLFKKNNYDKYLINYNFYTKTDIGINASDSDVNRT
jgi:hypothetical protein